MVSDSMSRSLKNLSERIEEAEKFLRKQPGATRVYVEVDEVIVGEANQVRLLEFSDENELVVRSYDDGELVGGESLRRLPVSTRLEFAQEIPALVEKALARETEIEREADETSAKIEQCLREAKERSPS